MAYQTGATSTVTDLADTITAFAITQGWTAGPTWSYTTSGKTYTCTSLRKGTGAYITFMYENTVGSIQLNTATAITGVGDIKSQTNACPYNAMPQVEPGANVGYHLFSDGVTVNCAIETVSGVWSHINFGDITKNGAWSGGEFVTGMCGPRTAGNPPWYYTMTDGVSQFPFFTWTSMIGFGVNVYGNGHLRSSVFGANRVAGFGTSATLSDTVYNPMWVNGAGLDMLNVSPNKANGRATIHAIPIIQPTAGADTPPYYQLGYVNNVGLINITNLNAKDVVNTNWMVFPLSQKNGPGTTYLNSQNYGIAYKK